MGPSLLRKAGSGGTKGLGNGHKKAGEVFSGLGFDFKLLSTLLVGELVDFCKGWGTVRGSSDDGIAVCIDEVVFGDA